VLAITGSAGNTKQRGEAVHERAAAGARPEDDLVPPQGMQADAAPLRLSEDFRRLQQPLHLLHHPLASRRSGLAPGA
jgi:hypothetical protein